MLQLLQVLEHQSQTIILKVFQTMIYYFKIDIGNQIITRQITLNNKIIRNPINNIKAYKRPQRNTQQIYINNKYFMSVVARQTDYKNQIGNEFINLIQALYIRGTNLKDIKRFIETHINKYVKRVYVNPELILNKLKRDIKKFKDIYEKY